MIPKQQIYSFKKKIFYLIWITVGENSFQKQVSKQLYFHALCRFVKHAFAICSTIKNYYSPPQILQ